MNYTNSTLSKRKKEKQKNIFMLIVGIICIFFATYILSKTELPFISNISSVIVKTVDNINNTVTGVIKEGFSYFGNTKLLNKKIEELEKEINKKDYELLDMKKLEAENIDLKDYLEIKEAYNHFKMIYVNVVYRNFDNIYDSFTISSGSKDGIKEKATVISSKGLVGYISKVNDYTSEVTTILSPNISVSASISSINQLAIVKGDFLLKSENKMKLTNIPIDYEISVGDYIYTSGIGGIYKKGIKIGNITKIINKKNDIDRYAQIETSTDFSSLSTLAVISE